MLEASVITLTFNRPVTLKRCLESLSRQSIDKDRFELVLVDVSDAPMDDLVKAFSERLNINHITAENRGFSSNRNVGASNAATPLLVFIDDDCIAHDEWLEHLLAAARKNPDALIGGGVENMNPENAVSCAGQVITDAVDHSYNPPGGQATFFPGLNVLVPREPFIAIGGYDESYGRLAAEDRDLADRWLGAGFAIVKEPAAIVVHEHRTTFVGYAKQYFNYGRGAWRYHKRRRERGTDAAVPTTDLHVRLRQHIRDSMRELGAGMRFKVWFLLLVWEVSNAAGFFWQALKESIGRSRGCAST